MLAKNEEIIIHLAFLLYNRPQQEKACHHGFGPSTAITQSDQGLCYYSLI